MPDRIDAQFFPPSLFVSDSVECAVMSGAEWHHPFIAHLAPQGPGLGKAQVVGMARTAATDETGLPGHIAQMLFISNAPWGADRKGRFVDPAWSTLGLG